MRYAAVHRAFIVVPPASAASCAALGAWVRLAVVAADRESERIAAPGSDREALTMAGVTLAEIAAAVDAGLVVIDGGDLVIAGFDHDGLRAVNARRAGGAAGAKFGALGGRPRKNPSGTPPKPLKGLPGNPSPPPSKTPLTSPWDETPSDADLGGLEDALTSGENP